MKFRITESEKSEIRGLYNLNEQIIKFVKTGYNVGFQKRLDIQYHNENPMEILELENVVGDGDLISADLVSKDKVTYHITYRCSSKELTRDDGFKLVPGSIADENELETLKTDLNKFCNV